LGTTVTNRNWIHEELKAKLNSGSVCYHSVQDLLSSLVLSKILESKAYKDKTMTLPVVLYGWSNWRMRWEGKCTAYGRDEKCLQNIDWKTWSNETIL
jgi:hypothetical protein